jgi:hypothetical protein
LAQYELLSVWLWCAFHIACVVNGLELFMVHVVILGTVIMGSPMIYGLLCWFDSFIVHRGCCKAFIQTRVAT